MAIAAAKASRAADRSPRLARAAPTRLRALACGIQGDRRLPFPGRAMEIAAHERDNGGVMARVGAGRIEAAKAGERRRKSVDVARIRQNRCDLLVCAGIQGGALDSLLSSAEGACHVARRCQHLGELDQGRR